MKWISILVLIFWSQWSLALGLGVGTTSTTGGRVIPAFSWSQDYSNLMFSGFSTGVKTPLYYHSAWTVNMYTEFIADKLGQLDAKSWLGIGAYLAQRGLRTSTSSAIEKNQDFTGGPAIRVEIVAFSSVNFWVESIFGLEKAQNFIMLSSQDINNVGIGIKF